MKSYLLGLFSVAAATLLPGSTGPYAVSMQHVVRPDRRLDPNAPDSPRRFVTSLFLPIAPDSCEQTTVPYLSPGEEEAWGLRASSIFGLPYELVAGYEIEYCTPVNATGDVEFPVVIFGPGLARSRVLFSMQARELASQGYFVITMDYPYEGYYVEFPDGSSVSGIELPTNDTTVNDVWSQIRADDVTYILNNLDEIVSELPINVDTSRILQYGHSMGGNAAALTALRNPGRISGALNLDGGVFGSALEPHDIPYVFLNAHLNFVYPDSPEMWEIFHGPKLFGIVDTVTHMGFIDLGAMLDSRDIPPEMVELRNSMLGPIKGMRMIELVTSLVAAFADYVFEGRSGGLKSMVEFEEFEVYEDKIPLVNASQAFGIQ